MSHEAVFYVRKAGSGGEFNQKWLTVPSNNHTAAINAFRHLGYETRGGTIMNQVEATAAAERLTNEQNR